jgi:hypothetical protein
MSGAGLRRRVAAKANAAARYLGDLRFTGMKEVKGIGQDGD